MSIYVVKSLHSDFKNEKNGCLPNFDPDRVEGAHNDIKISQCPIIQHTFEQVCIWWSKHCGHTDSKRDANFDRKYQPQPL